MARDYGYVHSVWLCAHGASSERRLSVSVSMCRSRYALRADFALLLLQGVDSVAAGAMPSFAVRSVRLDREALSFRVRWRARGTSEQTAA